MKKMKKILPIAIIAIVVAIFGGCTASKKEATNQLTQPTATTETNKSEKDSGMMSGMMDKLEKIKGGESMKCVYTIKMGDEEFESESYVQGEKYKSISTMGAEEVKTYAIFDGEAQYSWVEGQTEGFKMSMDCMDDMDDSSFEDEEEDETVEEDIKGMEDIFDNAIDVDCQPVKNIDFSIPGEINFIDQCQMLKDQMKQLEELGGALPEGFEIPMDMME